MNAVISSLTVVVLFVLTGVLLWIYRQDTLKAAALSVSQATETTIRKDKQNENWAMELAKVSSVLETTQELLQAQQDSNKIILEANEKLTSQGMENQKELRGVREELRGVREELRQVREDLKTMTARTEVAEARAEAAEDKAVD